MFPVIKTAMLAVALAVLCVAIPATHAESIPTPLQQAQSGIPVKEVKCAGERVLVQSPSGIQACVFESSTGVLSYRGFVPADDTHVRATHSTVLSLDAAGSITDTGDLVLKGALDIDTFGSEGRTYAAVISQGDEGIQILDITDPYEIVAADSITDTDDLVLKGALDIDTFGSEGRTYAAVISQGDEGIQILDITDPYEIVAADSITHTYRLMLAFVQDMDVFGSEGRTYAAVASSHDGIQILDITDPYNIIEADTIIDVGDLVLSRPTNIDTFKLKDRTYAAVASLYDYGIQILDVSNPYEIAATDSITHTDYFFRPSTEDIDVYELGGRTYAAVTTNSGIWTLDVTDPHRIATAGNITYSGFEYFDSGDTGVFTVDGRAYAAVASNFKNNVQVFDITDPGDIVAAGGIGNLRTVTLGGASAIDTFESGGRTYAAVASYDDGGVQILQLTAQADLPPTPRQQVLGGVSSDRIVCTGDRVLMQSPSGAPACVFTGSAEMLLGRGFTSFTFEEPDPIPPGVASANNAFAVDFYKKVAETAGNHFFSPSSMHAAFSVLHEGARGETAEQIREAFGLILDDAARHQSVHDTMSSLNRYDPHATLEMANSLWLADRLVPRSEYVDIVRGVYRADIETVDFTDKGTVDRINGWADKKTRGKIPEVLSPDDMNEFSMAAILNAIYFKGTWANQFPVKDTRGADFWTGTGTVKADFMNIMAEFEYAKADGVQVLRMPYKGDRLSMLVVLPNERGGLAALEGNITHTAVGEWRNLVSNADMVVSIPKFEAKTRYDLTKLLPHLGITDVFDESLSDLSGMGDGPLFIGKATQDAYVNVNEEGTEAAAVTSLVTTLSSPPSFVADRPFLFFIIDDESGTILFMGRVADPTA